MNKTPLQRLIKLIASERDRHQLVTLVAADAELLREVRSCLGAGKDGSGPKAKHLLDLCLLHQVSPDFLHERLGLIAHTLNLLEQRENHYAVLGIDRNAGREEIKGAFRRLSLACHPDTNPDDPEAAERFRMVHRAYEILSNDELRQHYDRHLKEPAWTEGMPAGWDNVPVKATRRWGRMWQFGLLLGLLLCLALLVDYDDLVTRGYYRKANIEGTGHGAGQDPSGKGEETLTGHRPGSGAPEPGGTSYAHSASTGEKQREAGDSSPSKPDSSVQIAQPDSPSSEEGGDGTEDGGPTREPDRKKPVHALSENLFAMKDSRSGEDEGDRYPPPASPSVFEGRTGFLKRPRASQPPPEGGMGSESPLEGGIEGGCCPGKGDVPHPSTNLSAPEPSRGGGSESVRTLQDDRQKIRSPEASASAAQPENFPSSPARHEPEAKRLAPAESSADPRASRQARPGGGHPDSPAAPEKAHSAERKDSMPHISQSSKGPAGSDPVVPGMLSVNEMSDRIQRFIACYVKAYQDRNAVGFLSFFDSNALENGQPVRELMGTYVQNFQKAEWIRYRIGGVSWSLAEEGVYVKAKFSMAIQFAGEAPRKADGPIHFLLAEKGDGFRVKRLDYSYEPSR